MTKEVTKTIELIISKKEYYFAINCDKTLKDVIISVNIKYKPTKDLYYLQQIYYSTESKTEFKLDYDRPKYPSWRINGNEYIQLLNLILILKLIIILNLIFYY